MKYTKDNPFLVKMVRNIPVNFTGVVKDEYGDIFHYLNGLYHREDGPACEYADGSKHWYFNGKLHRTDGPAKELSYGRKEWWLNDNYHREDGPACEYANGDKGWYLNGKRYGSNDDYTNESWIRFIRLELLK